MLSWNYWISDGYILPASPDGRLNGEFLSNAICPVNGADTKGPTANITSVGIALGGNSGNGMILTMSIIFRTEHAMRLHCLLQW